MGVFIVTSIQDKRNYLSGRYVNTDLQYIQRDYPVLVNQRQGDESVDLWRNDTAFSQLSLTSYEASLNEIQVEIGVFKTATGETFDGSVASYFIDSTQAYTNLPAAMRHDGDEEPPAGHRKEANEILSDYPSMNMPAESVLNIWLATHTRKDTVPGIYHGNISIHTAFQQEALVFPMTIEVHDHVFPEIAADPEPFDIELWQNPYALAEYYDVEPFSAEHLLILKPHMEKYRSLGGQAITTTISEEAWNGQTYSKNKIRFPSMVKWTRKKDGSFIFDYTHFDRWVRFNLDLGLAQKIVCYSIVPWNDAVIFYDEATKQQEKISYEIGDEQYLDLWRAFLTDFVQHTTDAGWFDRIYIGIDERGFHQAAFDLIDDFRNDAGEKFKVSGAMDNIQQNKEFAMLVDDLTVGTIPIKKMPAYFAELCEKRKAAGLKTTVYSCTGHKPGNFALSAPGESYWTIVFAYLAGAEGFLRWAYDSWVEEPLVDVTHRMFEAGDCFLVYPGQKKSEQPISRSSTRLEKLAEGVRAANKLRILLEGRSDKEDYLETLRASIKNHYSSIEYYLDADGKADLVADMAKIRNIITELSRK